MISTLLGNWLNLDESELSLLTIAATLHDVGKMKVPEEILNKPGKLTYEEFEEVKKHTVYGYEIIKSTYSLTHRCALVALQHHEREDGKGYPFGLKKDKIDYLSKIVAVADVFHAMTSQRVYQDAKPFYMVVEEMRQGTFGKFDPHIVNVFLQKIMDTLVGNTAVLTDGRVGTIVMIHYEDPFNPLIQSGDEFIDLRKEVDVHLDKVLDE